MLPQELDTGTPRTAWAKSPASMAIRRFLLLVEIRAERPPPSRYNQVMAVVTRDVPSDIPIVTTFAVATFLGALLLFMIEPIFAKMALPLVGGSPAIWTTAVLFFQLVLLASYAYVHVLGSLPRRWGFAVHATVLAIVLIRLPLAIPADVQADAAGAPVFAILRALLHGTGLAFFALAATSPLLQLWLSRTNTRAAQNPYALYAASNFGSLIGLVAYPLIVEPFAGLRLQNAAWMACYVVFGILLVVSFFAASAATPPVVARSTASRVPKLGIVRRLRWIALAFVPSSVMLGMTAHVSMMIAPMPLLWTLPLALYLSTFVIAFAPGTRALRWAALRAAPFVVLVAVMLLALHVKLPPLPYVALHLAIVFLLSLACHGALADDKPEPAQLTQFYVWLSVGGALGGVFNAIVAPLIFPTVAEYPIAIVLGCALCSFYDRRGSRANRLDVALPILLGALLWLGLTHFGASSDSAITRSEYGIAAIACFSFVRRPLRFAAGICALLLLGSIVVSDEGKQLSIERNFFGVKTVSLDPERPLRLFIHNGTLHGIQSLDPAHARDPLAYYSSRGPLGKAFAIIRLQTHGKPLHVSVAGLGIGSAACYARPDDAWTYFEIDPAVVEFARHSFSFLSRCTPHAPVVLGDARLSLEAPGAPYDVIILDAYSSDSPPVHLLSREAFAVYLSRLRPDGYLLVNISNRYFDLEPILAAQADYADLVAVVSDYMPPRGESERGAFPSEWVVMSRRAAALTRFGLDPRWRPVRLRANLPLWTDDYSSLLRLWMPV
jgi:SAM-dependent methyltransferase